MTVGLNRTVIRGSTSCIYSTSSWDHLENSEKSWTGVFIMFTVAVIQMVCNRVNEVTLSFAEFEYNVPGGVR